ncbi:GPI anchored protein [Paecilomyces variotii No. 5]|uniref:GPI anchored protein n=1 Tax=Byssochlamys spectabilis (strain No. 5 / NBRC 109023) TaxID=1356009 RepID=V5FG77_BYSSN|nr:GPI anchored protein [Paecilomyces variotii No. 5]
MRLFSASLSLLSCPTFLLLSHPALASADGRDSEPADNVVQDAHDGNTDSFSLREYAVARKLASNPVLGVKKMSNDEGEKFWPEYWYFGGEVENIGLNNTAGEQDRHEEGDSAILVLETLAAVPRARAALDRLQPAARVTAAVQAIREEDAVSQAMSALIATVTVTIHPTVTRPHSTPTSSPVQSTSSTSITSSETTGGLVPPARPTSVSTITTQESSSTTEASSSTTSTTSTPSGSVCPTGFYACSAVYHGGCCRTGRNCDTTSCPISSSSTFTSDGRTIVVPAGTTTGSAASGSNTGAARCASGWFSCADTAGGGCCPTGFACGTSCMATAGSSATGSVPKAQPEQPAPNGGAGLLIESIYLKLLLLAVLYFGVLF